MHAKEKVSPNATIPEGSGKEARKKQKSGFKAARDGFERLDDFVRR
jgi:hypothetical protein